jgi:hypothetical protein
MPDYTNYSTVSWSDLTPITSVRLNQMSTNIDQVKLVNDSKPKGILKIREATGNVSNGSVAGDIFKHTKIISLTQETEGNVAYDNRVTLSSQRYYRLTFICPGIVQADAGGEDSIYYIRFRTGNTANTGTILSTFVLSSGAGLYINTDAEAPTTDNITLRSDIVFGAGTYSYVFQGTNANNESHIVELERYKSNSNNASGWTVLGAAGKMQFYIEDIGEWIGQA